MQVLARLDSASAGSGFSWKPWMRPSSPVITTPNWDVSVTRLVARVAIPSWDSWNSAHRPQVDVGQRVAGDDQGRSRLRNPATLRTPPGGAEQLLLAAVGELDARAAEPSPKRASIVSGNQ